jgi:alcohol dehydrogenase (quinone), cytochrome c subunit
MMIKNVQGTLLVLLSWLIASAAGAQPTLTATAAPVGEAALIQRGAYLARAGDCVACHTADHGKPFAGGLPLKTPVGTVYSTNITPDKNMGIGNYSYDDFDKALRYGIAKKGYSLYPAMPYPSYANVKSDDVKALYAYFMNGVIPVPQANVKSAIPWPLSMRWPLSVWRKTFGPKNVAADSTDVARGADLAAGDGDAVELSRGRYLVEGLGHCSACHTPRGIAFQEKALSDRQGTVFLSGAVVDGWFAKSLRSDSVAGLGSWSRQDIAAFLKTGRNAHSAAFGSMTEVVQDSTQYLNDGDLNAIAAYLKSMSTGRSQGPPLAHDDTVAKALRAGDVSAPGALLFVNNCAACHRTSGVGYGGVFPQLAHSSMVNSDNPTSLIHIVLTGSSMPSTQGAPTSFTMPDFAVRLTDQQVADVVTFVRQSWGNRGTRVDSDEVGKVRKNLGHTEQQN